MVGGRFRLESSSQGIENPTLEYDLDVAQRRNRGWGDVGWFGATMSRLMEKGMKLLEPHLGYTPDELVEAMEQTVARQVRLSGEDSGPAANNRLDLAEALVAADRPVEARLLLEEVLAACRRNRGDEDEQTFTAELLLARSLASEGMLDEALSLGTRIAIMRSKAESLSTAGQRRTCASTTSVRRRPPTRKCSAPCSAQSDPE